MIIRIVRATDGWCFPSAMYCIEVFTPVGTTSWQRKSLAAWRGKTVRGAIARWRGR